MVDETKIPGWPTANVDFDAVQAAAKRGKLDEHFAKLEADAAPKPPAPAEDAVPAVDAK